MLIKTRMLKYNTETGEELAKPIQSREGWASVDELTEQIEKAKKAGANAIGFKVKPVTKADSKYSHVIIWDRPFELGPKKATATA